MKLGTLLVWTYGHKTMKGYLDVKFHFYSMAKTKQLHKWALLGTRVPNKAHQVFFKLYDQNFELE